MHWRALPPPGLAYEAAGEEPASGATLEKRGLPAPARGEQLVGAGMHALR